MENHYRVYTYDGREGDITKDWHPMIVIGQHCDVNALYDELEENGFRNERWHASFDFEDDIHMLEKKMVRPGTILYYDLLWRVYKGHTTMSDWADKIVEKVKQKYGDNLQNL